MVSIRHAFEQYVHDCPYPSPEHCETSFVFSSAGSHCSPVSTIPLPQPTTGVDCEGGAVSIGCSVNSQEPVLPDI